MTATSQAGNPGNTSRMNAQLAQPAAIQPPEQNPQQSRGQHVLEDEMGDHGILADTGATVQYGMHQLSIPRAGPAKVMKITSDEAKPGGKCQPPEMDLNDACPWKEAPAHLHQTGIDPTKSVNNILNERSSTRFCNRHIWQAPTPTSGLRLRRLVTAIVSREIQVIS
ncbi:hypothetical protein ACXX9E_29090, partial [Pseudomonas sp. GNP014]